LVALGFAPYVERRHQGPIIVNVHQPAHPSWDFRRFIELMKTRGVLISNFWNTKAPTIRIAAIGAIEERDIRFALAQIEATLQEMGVGLQRAA
jgi:2-aminoethylphosphonate-pyruvate transaminase